MSDPFVRMTNRLFARLGVEAVLRGATPTRAILSHGVALTGEYGQVTAHRSMASLPSGDAPRVGDALEAQGTNYVIDAIERDDGYTADCILR